MTYLIIANVETLSHDDGYSYSFSSDGHQFWGGAWPLAPHMDPPLSVMQSIVQILAPLEGGKHQWMRRTTLCEKRECLRSTSTGNSVRRQVVFLNYFVHLKRAVL